MRGTGLEALQSGSTVPPWLCLLSLPLSAPATHDSSKFLEYARREPTPGPLLKLPLHLECSQLNAGPVPSPPSCLCPSPTLSRRSALTTTLDAARRPTQHPRRPGFYGSRPLRVCYVVHSFVAFTVDRLPSSSRM